MLVWPRAFSVLEIKSGAFSNALIVNRRNFGAGTAFEFYLALVSVWLSTYMNGQLSRMTDCQRFFCTPDKPSTA